MYTISASNLAAAASWPIVKSKHLVETMDKIRALIVDDSSVMRKIVERSLRQAGLELEKVVEAGNGAEALAALGQGPVDLILCDINMPVMDGLEFVRALSTVENAKGVPVVMITTEGSETHVVQALSAGARGYIRKPFTSEQVKEHVLPVVGKKS
jgi:two-component system chemotaxis response regulator CheY